MLEIARFEGIIIRVFVRRLPIISRISMRPMVNISPVLLSIRRPHSSLGYLPPAVFADQARLTLEVVWF